MIQNRTELRRSGVHGVALDCLEAAITAAEPARATRDAVTLEGDTLTIGAERFDLASYDDVLIVGGGKAAGGVTRALESILGDRITGGRIVTKHPEETERVQSVVGDHPLPSATNVEAMGSLRQLVTAADEDTLVCCVVTGGASALLTAPAGDLTVDDLQEATDRLLRGGVPIEAINTVRKHCSESKGGRLAREAAPATVVGLLVSDVVGDDLGAIGSGPTVPDDSTFADALAVFEQYDVTPPEAVAAHLEAGAAGEYAETPTADDPALAAVSNVLISSNRTALDAAAATIDDSYTPLILTSRLRGEARDVATTLVSIAEEIGATGTPVEPPAVLLAGGETTVSVTGDGGSGGPNQELALSAALELTDDTVVAAVDTDGEDGSSDVAGAIVDATTVTDDELARAALADNDAGSALGAAGATIQTGPTGTNVNDVVVLVVPAAGDE